MSARGDTATHAARGWTSRRVAWGAVWVLVAVLLVGTQMPNAWRTGIELGIQAPFPLSSLAHYLVFVGLALVLTAPPLALRPVQVLLIALALALLSEGLQFFTVDRHPRLIDVGIDMAGALTGLLLCAALQRLVAIASKK